MSERLAGREEGSIDCGGIRDGDGKDDGEVEVKCETEEEAEASRHVSSKAFPSIVARAITSAGTPYCLAVCMAIESVHTPSSSLYVHDTDAAPDGYASAAVGAVAATSACVYASAPSG